MTDQIHTDGSDPGEGVIQFAYDLKPADGPVAAEEQFRTLAAWREIFRRLSLLGQESGRYRGLGFGNLSARDPERPDEFVITASQTSGAQHLVMDDLVRVVSCNLERFWVDAVGSQPPSSETLTHAMIYAADARISWVFHCHSPEIFARVEELALPATPADVSYGSSAMVGATASLLAAYHSRPLVFATLGHSDGLFSCGPTARDTGGLLVSYLARALAL